MPGPGALKSSGYGRGANEEVEAEEELNLEEDVAALLEGEELSDEFQEKAKTVFEAVVKTRIASAKEAMESQYEQTLVEQVEAIKSELTERVDGYLEYVAQEWINENELQVQNGIRGELSESFMTGLKGLFEEHYVQLPEEKYDVLEAMVSKLDEMENKLNEQIDSNVALTKRLSESVSDNILDDVCEGLALSQKEKLAGLAEGVEFESEEQYREKLVTLREAYFAQKPVTESQEVISEDAPVGEDVSPAMDAYLRALTQFN
jgi:predicted Zn-dependent protease with MMP-like domain